MVGQRVVTCGRERSALRIDNKRDAAAPDLSEAIDASRQIAKRWIGHHHAVSCDAADHDEVVIPLRMYRYDGRPESDQVRDRQSGVAFRLVAARFGEPLQIE